MNTKIILALCAMIAGCTSVGAVEKAVPQYAIDDSGQVTIDGIPVKESYIVNGNGDSMPISVILKNEADVLNKTKQRASEAGATLRDKPLEVRLLGDDSLPHQFSALSSKLFSLEELGNMNNEWSSDIYKLNKTSETYSPKSKQMETVLQELSSSIKVLKQTFGITHTSFRRQSLTDIPMDFFRDISGLQKGAKQTTDNKMKDQYLMEISNKQKQLNDQLDIINNNYTAKLISYIDRIEAL
jgi:hypothetical protein